MAPSPTIRRLLKETAELSASSSNPNPTFHAAPVSDSNLHEWHFTLLGPPSPSPYAGGLYHGRITLPTTYPLKPPNFRFLTPSGRFEVNREICLSISGFHEETWMPAWGVRTALTALRSFMAEKGSAGQVGGMEAKPEVRERLARESKGWRCEGCGSRTNSEIMRDWWEICKERGVKVEEEMSLEELPEGLSLEAREPGFKAEDSQLRNETQREHPQAVSSSSPGGEVEESNLPIPNNQALPAFNSAAPAGSSAPHMSSHDRTQAHYPTVQDSNQFAAHGAPPKGNNISPTARSSQGLVNQMYDSQYPDQHGRLHLHLPENPPSYNTPAPTPTNPSTAPQHAIANTNADEPATGTIDKAIGALFVALLIMILKKIFYPAGGSGGGMEGLYMSGD
jgi:ubiquitin-conjugating enzyme E2 J1